LVVALLGFAPGAGAHASLSGTDPGGGTTVRTAPGSVTLTFDEPVGVAFGGVKIFAPDGSLVGSEAKIDGDVVTVPMKSRQRGTYAVGYRIVSADAHPVRGAFVFHVGAPSKDHLSERKAKAATTSDETIQGAYGVARFVMLAGVLLGVGGALFALFAAPGWRARWVGWLLILGWLGCIASFLLDAAVAGGFTVREVLVLDVVREQAEGVYGSGTLVRSLLVLICLVVWYLALRTTNLKAQRTRILLSIPFVLAALSLAITGHAIAANPTIVRLPADMLHSLAAAVWAGGLLQLIAFMRHGKADGVDVPSATHRYSNIALGAVCVLVVTGVIAAIGEIGWSLDAARDTRYGQLVIAKVLLLICIVPLAWINRRRNVTAVMERGSSQLASQARERLRTFATGELILLLIVIALTAWLIASIPAKVAARPQLIDRTIELRDGGSLQVTIDPASVGRNEVHVYVLGEQSQPDPDVSKIQMKGDLTGRDFGGLVIPLRAAGPGHATTGDATIPLAGTWKFTVQIRRGRFDEERVRFAAKVAPTTGSD
jgi:copper transport protein